MTIKSNQPFKDEFLALLKKYGATLTVREKIRGYENYADGIDFDFKGERVGDDYVYMEDFEAGIFVNWEGF